MNMPCDRKITCPCLDEPIANFSSEEPDTLRWLAPNYYYEAPPLGFTWTAAGCLQYCESAISQEDANDCALRLAQQCVWDTWTDPDGNPVVVFCNHEMFCLGRCPDGSPYWQRQAAGTICGLSQAIADSLAQALACSRARTSRVCVAQSARQGCVDFYFECVLTASGSPGGVVWFFATALPAGLTYSATGNRNTIRISGYPTVSGTHTVTVLALDANGDYVVKTLTFRFLEITSPTLLDDGTIGSDYAYQFTASGGSGNYVWTLYDGILPDGLVLDPDGTLTGQPTTAGSYQFTVQACDLSF